MELTPTEHRYQVLVPEEHQKKLNQEVIQERKEQTQDAIEQLHKGTLYA